MKLDEFAKQRREDLPFTENHDDDDDKGHMHTYDPNGGLTGKVKNHTHSYRKNSDITGKNGKDNHTHKVDIKSKMHGELLK